MRKVVVLLAALSIVGFFAFRSLSARSAAKAEAAPLPLSNAVRSTLTDSAVAIGTVKSKVGAEVKVGSQLSGVVEELKVSVGDRVRKGDLLARLRDADLRARVASLESQLASAIAEKEYAESDLARTEQLGDLVPSLQIEDTRRKLKVRAADVERARASLAEAQITLGYTVIRAPVSGTIASVSTYEGETVAASFAAPTFVTIVDLSRLEIQAYVDETDIGRVHVGQKVSFRIDSFPQQSFDGGVRAIYPKAQLVNNVVNYVVIVDINEDHGFVIRPEMTAHVDFLLEERANVVNVPRSAVLREGGKSYVLVKSGENWVKRAVETGMETSQRIEITAGLSEGETIVSDKQAWKVRQEKAS
jgi:RND family efflux transporter MFP subunit